MNKRSAMLMAAGLVLSMVVAGIAISAGLTGPAASAAAPHAVRHHHPKPVVKTIRTTQTVHKRSPGTGGVRYSGSPSMVTIASAPGSASSAYHEYGDDTGSSGSHEGGSHSGGGDD